MRGVCPLLVLIGVALASETFGAPAPLPKRPQEGPSAQLLRTMRREGHDVRDLRATDTAGVWTLTLRFTWIEEGKVAALNVVYDVALDTENAVEALKRLRIKLNQQARQAR